MQLKEYQQTALDEVKRYLEALEVWREKNIKAKQFELGNIDFPLEAWKECKIETDNYISRENGLGESLPNFCLKIPTGGGKTLMAVKTIDLVNQIYFKKQTGLVLWIVPTTQIYNQTLKSLRDKGHPYRQVLDIASGNKTLVLEKMDHFTPQDLEENLAILLLMLPAASRRTKETLKVFRDNGFNDFFPPEDDIEGQEKLLELVPNLDIFGDKDGFFGRQIKTSLGNTLRILKPLIILDEGQKAYSTLAQETLRGFNPSMIVELSATPPDASNNLVDVSGMDLLKEEMIKLDMHVFNKTDLNWKTTLLASIEKRNKLEELTEKYRAGSGVYIRPICLIQVERTGKEQRDDGKYIHSEQVKEHLVKACGIPEEQIAIKTSDKDELKEIDEINGLLDENCQIRYIITKQALQEGWDCPFAYILTILNNPKSKNALTQLVGRILRQPYAKKIKIFPELDESYVYCYQQNAGILMESIRAGFKQEGLGDLASRISGEEGLGTENIEKKTLEIRDKFKKVAKEVVLPIFVVESEGQWRKVDYENDIASRIDWSKADWSSLFDLQLSKKVDIGTEKIASLISDRNQVISTKDVQKLKEGGLELDYVLLTRHIADIVPNPWLSYEIIQSVFDKLLNRNDKDLVTKNIIFILDEMLKLFLNERDRLSEKIFKDLISNKKIRFSIIGKNFYQLPETIEVKNTRPLQNPKQNWQPPQLSLFPDIPAEYFNEGVEKPVALYLDEQEEKLLFWYRNMAKNDYAIQGWRKNKVYADFIFTTKQDNKLDKVFIIETKGTHLVGNADSEYKSTLFKLCNDLAKEKDFNELGLLFKGKKIDFEFIPQDKWQSKLNELIYAA